ncbi:MAG: holo-ACP synthase [Anaerolineae bacterium]|nr:holo-ACP synthase [Anaerolineae bacterium]
MLKIGIDLVNMDEMAETLERAGDVFLRRVYSQREIERAAFCTNPTAYYAGAFAAKEAVFKALTLDWQDGINLYEIEVFRGSRGEALLELSGAVKAAAEAGGVYELCLSISYERHMAVAAVVYQAG